MYLNKQALRVLIVIAILVALVGAVTGSMNDAANYAHDRSWSSEEN